MAPKCTICGADDATSHVCAGELEQTYQRDLRSLAARTRETLAPPPPPGTVSLEAPASVRAAIRLADTLVPVARLEPAPVVAPAPGAPARGRPVVLAVVVLSGALGGALVWQAEGRVRQAPAAAAQLEAVLRPAETPVPERVKPVVATSAPARVEPPAHAATPSRRAPALVAKPRPTKPAPAAAATAEPAKVAQPTLMEAIVDSVASRRAPTGGPPTR
jgi:hypothetical protein